MLPFLQSLPAEVIRDLGYRLCNDNDATIPGAGTLKFVAQNREDSTQYIIFRYEELLYRLDGYYDSYGGGEYEPLTNAYEVKVVVKPVTFYERA